MGFPRKGLVLFLASLFLCKVEANQDDQVALDGLDVVTFYKDRYTNHRREPPYPQLMCAGGTAACSYTPDVVQCFNLGWSSKDYVWECKADLDSRVKFGKVLVSCEGYSGPTDPYVLKDSCSLEYGLDLIHPIGNEPQFYIYRRRHWIPESQLEYVLALAVYFAVFCGFTWCLTEYLERRAERPILLPSPPPYRPAPPPPPLPEDLGPPPPYGFIPPPPPSAEDLGPPPPYGFKSEGNCDGGNGTNPGRLGRFWTGAGIGGLVGYLFGSRNGRNGRRAEHSRPSSHGSFDGPASGFEAGGRRAASGFGGTRRR